MIETEKLIQNAIAASAFPGAVLAVGLRGDLVFRKAFGMADIFSGTEMTADTHFDLASLTKPLAVAPSLMQLVGEGRVGLDQPLGEILTAFLDTDKQHITPRQLLCHTAGFPDWRPWFISLAKRPFMERKTFLRQLLLAEPLCAGPGEKTLYSDLGFMLLEWVIETVGGKRIDRFIREKVYAPLGMADLFFVDLQAEKCVAEDFAATQLCPWRGRLLKGQVDDDNAWAMGGIAGQAGLFGTAGAVGRLIQGLLEAADGNGNQALFQPDIVRQFFCRQSDDGRALGFDVPTRPGSSSGRYFSSSSVGHLGFTGTSFWADPERSLVVVLLTNRVHPFRFRKGIRPFRPTLHDTIVQELGLA